jgi:hypothetical protein
MSTYHRQLASGQWFTLSLANQLGNVGSEYQRALRWKGKGDATRFTPAFERLLELLDLTIADPRWQNHRLKELTRLRAIICDELFNEVREFGHPTSLEEYFLYFGILARSERDKEAEVVLG